MARPLYSVSFVNVQLGDEDSAIYDVLDGFTMVVRDISGAGQTEIGSGAELLVTMNDTALYGLAVPENWADTFHWEGRVVAAGPSELAVVAYGPTCNFGVTISGYLLAA